VSAIVTTHNFSYAVDEYSMDLTAEPGHTVNIKRHGVYSLTMADALCKRLTKAGSTVMITNIADPDQSSIVLPLTTR